MTRRKKTHSGFTLVELLVVIGIIAVLISVLLPALNSARQQANLVACQSNLKQIGMLLQTYAAENKGYLPYGEVNVVPTVTGFGARSFRTPPGGEWTWWDTISIMSHKQRSPSYPNQAASYLGILRDKDVVDSSTIGRGPGRYGVAHYMGHMRAMIVVDQYSSKPWPIDPSYGSPPSKEDWYPLCKLKSVRPASSVMIVWDGPVLVASSNYLGFGGTRPTSLALDNWAGVYSAGSHGYLRPPADPYWESEGGNSYAMPVFTGPAENRADPRTPSQQKLYNTDSTDSSLWDRSMRFRHMKNTTGNFLFGDGHVESRKAGTITVKEICMGQ